MAINIGVLRGGPSSEHEISLKAGRSILAALSDFPKKYSSSDIVLSRNGEWVMDGKKGSPENILNSVDVVLNSLRGSFGEDGGAQKMMEIFDTPYAGSSAEPSAQGIDKVFSRRLFVDAGFFVPLSEEVSSDENIVERANNIFKYIGPPWVVKPSRGGSSVGVSIAENFNSLIDAMVRAFLFGEKIIVEEYISGKEFSCGVLEDFREEKCYALPVAEIILPEKAKFLDFNSKYGGVAKKVCPAEIDLDTKKEIENMAKKIHQLLDCRHYTTSDFILDKKGRIYVLEVNTSPELSEKSIFAESAKSVGLEYPQLLEHLIALATQ
jgi:D-alanine-D-alanine ligase